MPKTILVGGVKHVFPDEATDDDINVALGGNTAAQPPTLSAPPQTAPQPQSWTQRMRSNLDKSTQDLAPTGGFLHDKVVAPAVHVANRVGKNLGGAAIGGIESLAPDKRSFEQQMSDAEEANKDTPLAKAMTGRSNWRDTAQAAGDAVLPGAGTYARGMAHTAKTQGAGTAALDAAGDLATAGITAGVMHGAAQLPGKTRNWLTKSADEVTPGAGTTPRQSWRSAKNLGVNLDAADATGNPALKMVKKVNEHSLLGSGVYEKAKAKNLSTLDDSATQYLDDISPLDREGAGNLVQSDLRKNQEGLKTAATEGFDALDQRVGNQPIATAAKVGETAKGILAGSEDYYNQFPSLRPSKATSVLSDLTSIGEQRKPKMQMSGLVDESGKPIPSSTQPAPPSPDTFGKLQRVRSGVQDVYRNNQDLVQGEGNGMLQRMVGETDNAMTDAASGLPEDEIGNFRKANSQWRDMKETYDDPSSPFYHAVRTNTPSTLAPGVGGKSPEMVRSTASRVSPEAMGGVRRTVAEDLMGTDANGSYGWRGLPGKLNKMPEEYRQELFRETGGVPTSEASTLQDIAGTGQTLMRDTNPSGSGKLTQKILEGSALAGSLFNPLAAIEPLAQYPIAKGMNSPALVDWLMKERAPRKDGNFMKYGAAGAVTGTEKGRGR